MPQSTLAALIASLLLVGLGLAADEVRATSSSAGHVTLRTDGAADAREWTNASVATRESSTERSTIERAAAALRRSVRAPIATVAPSERDVLGGGSHLVSVAVGDAAQDTVVKAASFELWYRRAPGATGVWLAAPKDGALGRCLALSPAFDQGAQSGAAWLLGCELLASTAPKVWASVLEHRSALGRDSYPGELVGRSTEELSQLMARVQSTAFEDDAIAAARDRLWDGTTLRVSAALDVDALGAALFTFGATTDELGAALRAQSGADFRTAFGRHWDTASTTFATVATKVPDGALDLTRNAWERSSEAAQARATHVLEAVGGAGHWAQLVGVRMVVTTKTTTQAGVQSADSTTVRKLDGALTRIDQRISNGAATVEFTTGVVGTRLWLQRDGGLFDLPASQVERVVFGEQRALPRVLSQLARKKAMGARTDGQNLVLFDDSGDVCLLELDQESVPTALVQLPGSNARRFELSDWKDFDGCLYPTHHRETGERPVDVTVTEFARLETLDLQQFSSPLRR